MKNLLKEKKQPDYAYALKLYSTDTHLFKQAKKLVDQGKFNLIEINVVSDMQKDAFSLLDNTPTSFHFALPKYHIVAIGNGMLYENMIHDTPDKVKGYARLCFDFEKAAKAAVAQDMTYEEYLLFALQTDATSIPRQYFHVSGFWRDNPDDEHLNLWEGDTPALLPMIKRLMPKGSVVVFEVPKNTADLDNDVKNLKYFKEA